MVYILLFAAADVFCTLFSIRYMVKTGESSECTQIREVNICVMLLCIICLMCGFGSNPQQGMDLQILPGHLENPKIEIIWSTHYMGAELFETC